jgi:hypothetical protein
VSVAVLVIVKPLPVNPFTPDKLPIYKLEAVLKFKLPEPIFPASISVGAVRTNLAGM